MKKINLIALLISILIPLNVFAYSDYIIPGGTSVGININTDGILVVGFYKINGRLTASSPTINIGDRITHINGKEVNTISEMVSAIEDEMKDEKVKMTLIRNDKTIDSVLTLVKEDNTYKTGLYVKDSILGIGTLTYIDPKTKIYGALGHEIIESNTNSRVEVKDGSIFRSSITSIDRSVSGTPGGKNAKFYSNIKFGSIEKNVEEGIYGIYTGEIDEKRAMKVAEIDEIKEGRAVIYTVLQGEKYDAYDINITKVDKDAKIENIYFEVIDKELLEKTGGIVQGMSGSPIIQDDKIIGAVTHVVISNPSNGYGISITKMLETGEK